MSIPRRRSRIWWGWLLFLLLSVPSLARLSDSVTTSVVEPGVRHHVYTLSGPFSVHVLEIDLRSNTYAFEAYRPDGLVPTSLQVEANRAGGRKVLGGINADFFSFHTGWPLGNQVQKGEFIVGTLSVRSHIAFDRSNRPLIDRISFHGSVRTSKGTTLTLHGVNQPRKLSSSILYTPRWTSKTEMDVLGTEFALSLLSPAWSVADTLRFVVQAISTLGGSEIPPGGAVLWVGNSATGSEFQDGVTRGDTIAVFLGFQPHIGAVQQVIGGGGRILQNGQPVTEEQNKVENLSPKFLTDRHPRTFVAFNQDTTTLYLCTVDGRQPTSLGINFEEMARFLLSIGAWNAINLDGGGSTTMVILNHVVNSPSDKNGERPVANSLQLIDNRSVPRSHTQ